MFKCCSALNPQQNFVDRIQPCRIHGKQIHFICKSYDTCQNKALFCADCSDEHKGHTYQRIGSFFNEEVKAILINKPTDQQSSVESVLNKIMLEFENDKDRIYNKFMEIENSLKSYFEELIHKYPSMSNFRFREFDVIDNQKMAEILKILRHRENSDWIEELQCDFKYLIKPTLDLTIQELDSINKLVKNKGWDHEIERQRIFKEHLQKYFPTKEGSDSFHFKFSQYDKSSFIKVQHKGLEAMYQDDSQQNFHKPAVLTTRKLTPQHNKVYFKIDNVPKTVLIFDASNIGIGVCIPHNAKSKNYLNLHKHSHGAYMMLSNGKVFHSKLPEYINSDSGFSFGKGDIVEMWIDYDKRVIHFERQGFLKHKFEMELGLNDKYMEKLRPFVMFEGQQGSIVTLISNLSPNKPNTLASKTTATGASKASKYFP